MSRKTLLASTGGIILGGVLFNAVPALADLPVIGPLMMFCRTS
jgi:hypothetical protein